MAISEQELRSMIRDAIAQHTGAAPATGAGSPQTRAAASCRDHASHSLVVVVSDGDGECIIEPSVRCDHCGYCKSLGH